MPHVEEKKLNTTDKEKPLLKMKIVSCLFKYHSVAERFFKKINNKLKASFWA